MRMFFPHTQLPSVQGLLRAASFKQEPPRRRMILWNNSPYPIEAPWVSVLGFRYAPLNTLESRRPAVLVFHHDRAWENYEDAAEIMFTIPAWFHTGALGIVCIGSAPHVCSPSEAFWMTSNVSTSFPPPFNEEGGMKADEAIFKLLRVLKDTQNDVYAW